MTQNNLPDGTIIAFSSKFSYKRWGDWRHAITKPLHYGIQFACSDWFSRVVVKIGLRRGKKLRSTPVNFHHVGIMCDGWLYEAMASTGVRRVKLGHKLREIDDCVEVIAFEPNETIAKESLKLDLIAQIGKEYPTWQALGSILTKILFWQSEIKTALMFCSKLVAYAFRNLFAVIKHIIPRKYNPNEIIKFLLEKKLIKSGFIIKKAYA